MTPGYNQEKRSHSFFRWTLTTIVCLAISACSMSRMFSAPAPVFTVAPNIVLDPNLNTPLAGLLTLTTNVPTRIKIEINSRKNSLEVNLKKLATSHTTPVLGLRPNTTHTIKIHATTATGATKIHEKPLTVTTDPLQDGFPSIEVTTQPEKMELGYTHIEGIPEARKNKGYGATIDHVDSTGEVGRDSLGSRWPYGRQLRTCN